MASPALDILLRSGRLALSDTFSRADDALTLGTAETGQVWSAISGTWGVIDGQLYCPSDTSTHLATINPGAGTGNAISTLTVSGTIAAPGTDSRFLSLAFRVIDGSNLLRVFLLAGSVSLQKIVAGSGTTLASASTATVDGAQNRLGVRYVGQSVLALLNGTPMFAYTLTDAEMLVFPTSATAIGTRLGKAGTPGTVARGDNLVVRALS